MRLITYNVEYCQGMNKKWKYLELQKYMLLVKRNLMKMTDYLQKFNPDILGLIEVDTASSQIFRKKSPISMFAENLKMDYIAAMTKYARRSFFYRVLRFTPVRRKHANAILSKYPLFDIHYFYLRKGVKKLVIHSKIKLARGGKVVNIHLFAVHLALTQKTRKKQISELGKFINMFEGPKIVFGDFNNFKGEKELEPLLEESKLVNAANFSKDSELRTFPSWNPKRHIDHVLVSKEIDVTHYDVLDIDLSDHFPVMVDFELK